MTFQPQAVDCYQKQRPINGVPFAFRVMGRSVGSLQDLAAYKGRLEEKALAQALALTKAGRGKDAADALDRLAITQQQMLSRGEELATAYYRRALVHQCEHHVMPAINDLERARAFTAELIGLVEVT